jgi:hypothetical protein
MAAAAKRPSVKHSVRYDEPSAVSRRLQKAVCGAWVYPSEVSARDDVTCPRCQEWWASNEAMEI